MQARGGMGGSALAEARRASPVRLLAERLWRPLAVADALLWRLLVALVQVALDGLAEYGQALCRPPGHPGPPDPRDEHRHLPSASDRP